MQKKTVFSRRHFIRTTAAGLSGIGCQQRSDPNFQHAVSMVREGKLGRTVRWDPNAEKFLNDTAGTATAHLHYPYRKGWTLF
ncbi:MAG: hypothetical protein AB7D05_00635 [Mangrovibacterium sp.]